MFKKFTTLLIIFALTSCVSNTSEGENNNKTLAVSANAAPTQLMRFHCDSDTTDINKLLQKGADSKLTVGTDLVAFYADLLLGTPYVAHTLEGETEMLTINIHELDCTTFVETLYALARTTLNNRLSWRDYAHYLEDIRYRHGEMGDYSTRLHYMSDWLVENISRGNVVDITPSLPGVRYQVKTIDFMTTHRDSYPSLASDTIFQKIKNIEMGYRNHRYPYIPKGQLSNKGVREQLREGDMAGLVTNIGGLDISHLGIIKKDEKGNIYLLDASSRAMKVVLEDKPLHLHLSGSKSTTIGVRIWRIKD